MAKEERDGKGGFNASSSAIVTEALIDPFVILYAPKVAVPLILELAFAVTFLLYHIQTLFKYE